MGHTSFQFDRRTLLKGGALAAGALALGPAFLRRAFAAGPVTVGDGPYGPLQPFDGNGIALPAGFSSREIARGGSLVNGSAPAYAWHGATDGQATFATRAPGGGPDGGCILVANSEMPIPGAGGASAVEFAPGGGVERAYRILAGTLANCAGGPTPWGTWLSCEEHDQGRVWECDPTGAAPATPRPAMGVFSHEAASVDTVRECVYLTEDEGDGCFYRFTPTDYPDLSAGLLEVAVADGSGAVTWVELPDPGGGAANPTRSQVPAAARFNGGEGTWYDEGIAYFTTKGDGRVWAYHAGASRLDLIYDEAAVGPDAPLSGVDNITVSPSGDIYVCEDGRDHDICLITPGFEVARFLKLHPEVHSGPPEPSPVKGNETVGVVFDPSGERMYFGAQRSFGVGGNSQIPAGVVYEVTGPFRAPAGPGTGGNPPRGGPGAQPRLWAQPRRRARRFLREGLPVRLDLPEPMGVDAVLRASYRGADDRRKWTRIGSASPSVALDGRVTIKLDPVGRGRRVLRGRRRVGAKLTVVATNGGGARTVLDRDVVLWNPHPRHPLR